jgi:type I restriction enzyme R subunit
MADTRERVFQNDILAALESQGWLVGKASEYDKVTAIFNPVVQIAAPKQLIY